MLLTYLPGERTHEFRLLPRLSEFFSVAGFYATYFRWHIYNAERVPLKGPIILYSNRTSYLDPQLKPAPAFVAQSNYLARNTLFRYPGVGWL